MEENNNYNNYEEDEKNVCPIQQRGLLSAAIRRQTRIERQALLDQQRADEIKNLEAGLGLGGTALIY